MCTKNAGLGATAAAVRAPRDDDVWADDSSSSSSSSSDNDDGPSGQFGEASAHQAIASGGSGQRMSHLDREWQARKQQFYAAGFREGVAEAKEATLQAGFNAGFSEGAQAGYEFGLVKGALQTLATHLPATHPARVKVAELRQQLAALSDQAVMRDTCRALLRQAPVEAVAQHLRAALVLAADDRDGASPHAAVAARDGGGQQQQQQQQQQQSRCIAAEASVGSSSSQQQSAGEHSTLPQQLVRHIKQELLELGFVLGSAPPLTVASAPPQAAAAADDDDYNGSAG